MGTESRPRCEQTARQRWNCYSLFLITGRAVPGEAAWDRSGRLTTPLGPQLLLAELLPAPRKGRVAWETIPGWGGGKRL